MADEPPSADRRPPSLGERSFRLPGEDPATDMIDDARVWAGTYREFTLFIGGLISRSSVEEDPVLEGLQERYVVLSERADFWERRVRELDALDGRQPEQP